MSADPLAYRGVPDGNPAAGEAGGAPLGLEAANRPNICPGLTELCLDTSTPNVPNGRPAPAVCIVVQGGPVAVSSAG